MNKSFDEWIENKYGGWRFAINLTPQDLKAAYDAGMERAAEIAEKSIGEGWACCTNSVMEAVEAIRVEVGI